MSFEESVKRKHAFDNALKDYLRFVSVMTREEIELTLGRLADMLNTCQDEREALQIKVRGGALKIYLDLRNTDIKKQSKVKRITLVPAMKRFFAEQGEVAHTNAMKQYQAEMQKFIECFSQWKKEVKELPFVKRILAKPPQRPSPPFPIQYFVKKSKSDADMSEYLITTTANFCFPYLSQEVEDITVESVKQLAP